ncbi:MAG TPA: hypothetical protein VIY86_02210, partial [Pirellulaceae bacterium]
LGRNRHLEIFLRSAGMTRLHAVSGEPIRGAQGVLGWNGAAADSGAHPGKVSIARPRAASRNDTLCLNTCNGPRIWPTWTTREAVAAG